MSLLGDLGLLERPDVLDPPERPPPRPLPPCECARCEGEGWLMEDANGVEHPAADGDGQYRCRCNHAPETPGSTAPVTASLEPGRTR